MKIRLGYDLGFEVVGRVPMTTVLDVNPSRRHDLLEPDQLVVSPGVPIEGFTDLFGNRCHRFVAPGRNSLSTRRTRRAIPREYGRRSQPVSPLPFTG